MSQHEADAPGTAILIETNIELSEGAKHADLALDCNPGGMRFVIAKLRELAASDDPQASVTLQIGDELTEGSDANLVIMRTDEIITDESDEDGLVFNGEVESETVTIGGKPKGLLLLADDFEGLLTEERADETTRWGSSDSEPDAEEMGLNVAVFTDDFFSESIELEAPDAPAGALLDLVLDGEEGTIDEVAGAANVPGYDYLLLVIETLLASEHADVLIRIEGEVLTESSAYTLVFNRDDRAEDIGDDGFDAYVTVDHDEMEVFVIASPAAWTTIAAELRAQRDSDGSTEYGITWGDDAPENGANLVFTRESDEWFVPGEDDEVEIFEDPTAEELETAELVEDGPVEGA